MLLYGRGFIFVDEEDRETTLATLLATVRRGKAVTLPWNLAEREGEQQRLVCNSHGPLSTRTFPSGPHLVAYCALGPQLDMAPPALASSSLARNRKFISPHYL